MRIWVTWLVILGMALAWWAPAATAEAQSQAITLSALAIELWPEYDRSAMLVQISGTLAPNVPLPAQVVVRVPAASGGPLAVATRTAAGTLVNAPYTSTVSGDQILVTIEVDTADFHVEYYDPALAISGASRAFTFRWTSDYAVASTSVRLQAPVDSSQVTTEPALTPAGVGDYGLSYYTGAWGALTAGQEVRLQLSYSKSSSTLSADKVAASQPAASAQPGSAAPALGFSSPWLWGGIVAGAMALGAAVLGLWWLRSSQRGAPAVARRRGGGRMGRRRLVRLGPRQPSDAAASAAADSSPAGFCTQCGQPRRAGDRFCRSCGAPVRD